MSPSTVLLTILSATTFYHIKSETVNCNGDCTCTQSFANTAEHCILNCGRGDACKHSTLTCGEGRPCTIMCTDASSCADYAYINAISATHVSLVCSGSDACKGELTLMCGTGDCAIQCGPGSSCEGGIGMIDISRAQTFACFNCPPGGYADLLQFTPVPTQSPSKIPTITPTSFPTFDPSPAPTPAPTNMPSANPSVTPTNDPTSDPTQSPTPNPTTNPTVNPTYLPTVNPSVNPTSVPSSDPTNIPTNIPTNVPSVDPTAMPTVTPTVTPTNIPTNIPTNEPTDMPSDNPTPDPTSMPTTANPTTNIPTNVPSDDPTVMPTVEPTVFVFVNVTTDSGAVFAKTEKTNNDTIVLPMVVVAVLILIIVLIRAVFWHRKKRNGLVAKDSICLDDQQQNHGLIEIVNEGAGDGPLKGYVVRVHYNGRQFQFKLNGSKSGATEDCGWNGNTYDQLMCAIKKQFGIAHNNFVVHEMVDECPVDIEDIDDIAASFDCCYYDTNRRSIDLYVKGANDVDFGYDNQDLYGNDTELLDGEDLLEFGDSENDIMKVGR